MVGPFLGFGGHTMRIRLFPPYYSCRYSTSPVADWLDDFAQWLKVTGYTRTPMRGHISILRWALERPRNRCLVADASVPVSVHRPVLIE